MRRQPKTERIDVPESTVLMIEARTHDIVRACCYETNIIRSIALSCYLQGLVDGAQVAEQRPEVLAALRSTDG